MVVTAQARGQSRNGPRPINLNKDIPQIMHLLEICFGAKLNVEGQRMLAGPTNPDRQIAFLWRLKPAASKLALGYVWEDNGRIVGNVTVLTTKVPGRYLVVNVAVHPDHRRRGIARALMEKVEKMVQLRGGHEIILQVVKENEPARALYRALDYTIIGSMTAWYAPASRLRTIDSTPASGLNPYIRELRGSEWRAAYQLDQAALNPDLNWPEPLPHDAYKLNFWRRIVNFFNGRSIETWVIPNASEQPIGLASILSEWGRSHRVSVRVHPTWQGEMERPLVAKVLRRLQYLPRRKVRIDHPDDDVEMNNLLQAANFSPKRTLTHMRRAIG